MILEIRRSGAAAHRLIMENCAEARGVISYQVTQEFVNVAIRRITVRAEIPQRLEALRFLSMGMHVVQSSDAILHRALNLWDRYSLSWYDSLIAAAALQSDCRILYTEDMQHGLDIHGLRVVNPFL